MVRVGGSEGTYIPRLIWCDYLLEPLITVFVSEAVARIEMKLAYKIVIKLRDSLAFSFKDWTLRSGSDYVR